MSIDKYKVALFWFGFVFFLSGKETHPTFVHSGISGSEQRLLMKTQLPNTFHSLFAEGNVLYLLNFQIGRSKWASLYFLIKQEKISHPSLASDQSHGVCGSSVSATSQMWGWVTGTRAKHGYCNGDTLGSVLEETLLITAARGFKSEWMKGARGIDSLYQNLAPYWL